MKKKLLLFGNKLLDKELSQEQIDYINSFDIIVRVNKFDNLLNTGCRIDWYLPTCCSYWDMDTIRRRSPQHYAKHYDSNITKQISKLFVQKSTIMYLKQHLEEQFPNSSTDEKFMYNFIKILFDELDKNVDIVIHDDYAQSVWKKFYENNMNSGTTPTTTVLCLAYLIEQYSQEYDIYFACLDIEGRGEMLKTNPIWSTTVHRNAGYVESEFLQKMIKENKLHYIDLYA